MLEAVAQLADRWRNLAPGSTIDVAGEFTLLTLNVLALTIFADGIGGDFDEFSSSRLRGSGCLSLRRCCSTIPPRSAPAALGTA
jgi:hypothetical protein